jgi:hypothetical protein
MGCGSSGTNTVVQNSSPPPQVLNDYQNLINQGQAVSRLPLQQYQGPVIAGFNPTQQAAFSEVNQAQGSALPYINAAQSYLAAGAQPVMSQVQGFNSLGEYENPYTQQVTQATENLLNNQNAQQFNQANAAAASAGAFGGDRQSVLEAQMAQQQQLAEAPTLANIQSQGFTGAEQELNAQQNLQLQGGEGSGWLAENAAGLESGLGTTAQNSLLSGASAELQTGGLEQQLQQEELGVPESYFAQQQAFPYAATNYLAGITEGAAPGEGGTSSTTYPGPSTLGQIAGLGMTGLGAYGLMNNAGLFGSSAASLGGYLGSGVSTAGMGDLMGEAAGNILAGAAGLRRGGRTGFPSLHRDGGSFVPQLTEDDLAAIQEGINLAGGVPVPQAAQAHGSAPQIHGPGVNPPVLPGIDFGQILGKMGPVSNVLGHQPASGPSSPFPGYARGGFPRAFASSGNVGDDALPGDDMDLEPAPPFDVTDMLAPSAAGNAEDAARSGDALPPPPPAKPPVPGVDEGDAAQSPVAAGLEASVSAFPSAESGQAFPRLIAGPKAAPQEDGLWGALSSPWAALLAAGAGMLASRSPYAGVALGEGLESGLRFAGQQAQIATRHTSAPRVVSSGGTMKLVYPDGRIFDTGLAADSR